MTTETKTKILLFNDRKLLSQRDVIFSPPCEWYIENTEHLINLIFCYEPAEVSREELDAIKLMRHPYIIVNDGGNIREVLDSLVSSAKERELELEKQRKLQKEKEEKTKQKSEARKKTKSQKLLESLSGEEKKKFFEDLKKEMK